MNYKIFVVALALISLCHAGRIARSSRISRDDMLAYKTAISKANFKPFEYQDGSKRDLLNHLRRLVSRSSMTPEEEILMAHYTGLLGHAYDQGKFGSSINAADVSALRNIITKTGLMTEFQSFRDRLNGPPAST